MEKDNKKQSGHTSSKSDSMKDTKSGDKRHSSTQGSKSSKDTKSKK